MKTHEISTALKNGLQRGKVAGFSADGICLVLVDPAQPDALTACDLLQTSDLSLLRLAAGDAVVVWLPSAPDEKGVIFGRIGPSTSSKSGQELPDHLVLEATKGLTLQCGEGSITLRGDGKVLIKGKELVSRAEGTNRLKGGAVAIN